MTRDANWYGLNMLPLYVEMGDGQLQASLEQLKNLQKVQLKPHVLNDEMLHRIIKVHTSQNTDNWVFFEQCKKWREQNPNDEQLGLIAQVERNAYEREQVNHQILKLASSFKGKTIESILAKDPAELGLEFCLPPLE